MYTYNYGLNNELRSIQIPDVGSITIPDYTWNRPATVNYPGGVTRTSTYDALMRLESLTVTAPDSTPILTYGYPEYDEVGNILTKTTEHGTYTYDYDPSSRLITADNPVLADEAYTYDDVGNRLTSADVAGTWSHNQNNELLGYVDVEYEYDDNGNLTEIRIAGSPVWTYTYDAANRLVHAEDGTGTISADYYYDPFGRRLWKDVGGTKTYFFYSKEGLIAEYDETGAEIRSYGYKPDSTWTTDPLWLKEGGAYYWYQNDHLGTPQKLTAQDGTVVWSAQYTAFGDADVQVETIENNLRFPGQYYDIETGLHYNFHRYYNTKIGRYVSADPIGFLGGDTNLYEYTKDNPVNRFDALGLFWWVSRKKDDAKALAVCCNDTVEELAKKIGLDPYYYTEWLTPLDGEHYPAYPTREIRYQQFYIPNTVYAFWGGQLSGFGRWHTHWNESISYLQELGFKVIEYHHVFNKAWRKQKMGWYRPQASNTLNKFYLDDELIDLAKKKELHGLYFWGHGDKEDPNDTDEGLHAGNTTLRLPLFSETEGVLRYDYIQARLPYKMALGLIFACFSNIGKCALSSGTAGSIWEPGYDWYVIPMGVGTYHVGRWIKPGDQETRSFQFQWPPSENMDW